MTDPHIIVTPKKTLLADIGLVYCAAIWGSTFILVKSSLAHIDPIIMVAYRFLIAALVSGFIVVLQRKSLFKGFRQGILLGVVLAFLYIPQTIGLKYTSAANSAFITGLFVAFAPPLSLLLLKERTRLAQWLAVGISLVGLWLLTGGLAQVNLGDVITLSAAFTYALHIILIDRAISAGFDLPRLIFQQMLVVGVISLAVGLLTGRPLGVDHSSAVWVVVFLALFPTLSAFFVQLEAQKFTSPVKVSLIFALEPVFAGVFAWTLGGEPFIPLRALGGLLIFIAIVISTVQPKKAAAGESVRILD